MKWSGVRLKNLEPSFKPKLPLAETFLSLHQPPFRFSLSIRSPPPSSLVLCGQCVTEAPGWLMAVGEMSGRWICPSNSLVVDTLALTQTDCGCVFEKLFKCVWKLWERERESVLLCARMHVHVCVFPEWAYWKASLQSIRLAPLVD